MAIAGYQVPIAENAPMAIETLTAAGRGHLAGILAGHPKTHARWLPRMAALSMMPTIIQMICRSGAG